MCGLNGFVTLDPARAPTLDARAAIDAMNQALAHRGPDGEGRHLEDGLALGHRRLAIVDTSPAGAQPMHSADGQLVLVFNGEIYNHVELAQELAALGHVMRTRSDTEVILHAYARWGDACVQRFNGMWAFALWDRRQQRLLCSRDRLGVKPFVYHQHQGRWWFSSEAVGLRAVLPLHRADLGKLHEFLAWGYRREDGRSFFEGVAELPPAHNLVVQHGRVQLQRYWSLPERAEAGHAAPPANTAERAAQLHDLLADAVRLRLRSDVPVALLQSGGLDSSAIAVCVNTLAAAGDTGAIGGQPVQAFTSVHPGHASDESAVVARLMQGLPHLQWVPLQPPGHALADQLPAYVDALQEPQASATSFAHWSLMQAVRARGMKVVLNGQGADEALAGYGVLVAGYRLLDLLLLQPRQAAAEAAALHRVLGLGWPQLLAQTAKAALGRRAASLWRGWVSEGAARVLRPPPGHAWAGVLPEVPMRLAGDNLDRHLRSQLLHYGFGQILHYEDRSAMSQGVEIRSPFIDVRLMELAFGLPDADKLSGGRTKRLLRQAFAHELPAEIVDAGRKIGFATPAEQWLSAPGMQAWLRALVAEPAFRQCGLWQADALARRLLDPAAAARGFPVWRFVVTALWLRRMGITNS